VLQRQKKQSRLNFLYHNRQRWWTVSKKSEVIRNKHKFDFAFNLSEILAFSNTFISTSRKRVQIFVKSTYKIIKSVNKSFLSLSFLTHWTFCWNRDTSYVDFVFISFQNVLKSTMLIVAAIFSKTLFTINVCLNLMNQSEYIFCILLTRNSVFSLNVLIFNNKCISVVCDFNWFNTSSYFFLLHTSLNRMTLTECSLNFVYTFRNVLYLSKLTF